MSLKFGIKEGAATKELIPIVPSKEKPFHVVTLHDVRMETVESKQGDPFETLTFEFRTTDNLKKHIQRIFPIDENSDKAEKALENISKNIAHIYGAYAPIPKEGIGTDAKDILDFYNKVVLFFNKAKKDEEPIYKGKKVWLKLIYNPKGYIGTPYSPNYIELISEVRKNEEGPRTIEILPSDIISQEDLPKREKSSSGAASIADVGAKVDTAEIPEGW